MTNEQIAKDYLDWVGKNYNSLKTRMEKYCSNQKLEFDEDVWADTYLKIYERISKSGITDSSESGFLDYTFKSFKINTMREPQYARNRMRDMNIDSEALLELQERYAGEQLTEREKLSSDLFKDYAALYLMAKAEEHFDSEVFNLFKLKWMTGMTYKELRKKTGVKGCREKVGEVQDWLRENVTKEEIKESFSEIFQNLIC